MVDAENSYNYDDNITELFQGSQILGIKNYLEII